MVVNPQRGLAGQARLASEPPHDLLYRIAIHFPSAKARAAGGQEGEEVKAGIRHTVWRENHRIPVHVSKIHFLQYCASDFYH